MRSTRSNEEFTGQALAWRRDWRGWLASSFLALVLMWTVAPAHALEAPGGAVILTVDGKITVTNASDGTATFDRAMIEALGVTEIVTETPWTDGPIRFEGARVSDLLTAVGAQGTSVHAIAINDYGVDIPISDFQNYDVIIAYRANGKTMRIRDKGPLWVIYPWDDMPKLRDEVHHGRSIWQLKHLTVK